MPKGDICDKGHCLCEWAALLAASFMRYLAIRRKGQQQTVNTLIREMYMTSARTRAVIRCCGQH